MGLLFGFLSFSFLSPRLWIELQVDLSSRSCLCIFTPHQLRVKQGEQHPSMVMVRTLVYWYSVIRANDTEGYLFVYYLLFSFSLPLGHAFPIFFTFFLAIKQMAL